MRWRKTQVDCVLVDEDAGRRIFLEGRRTVHDDGTELHNPGGGFPNSFLNGNASQSGQQCFPSAGQGPIRNYNDE
jgi:hypothetical protein